jgi:hypothetical protein
MLPYLSVNIPCSVVGLFDLDIPAIDDSDSPNTVCGSISYVRDRSGYSLIAASTFLHIFARESFFLGIWIPYA